MTAKNSDFTVEMRLRSMGAWDRLLEMEERLEKNPCAPGSGVCSILKRHHEILSDDPERLSTEFCVGLVCGEKKLKKYQKKKG